MRLEPESSCSFKTKALSQLWGHNFCNCFDASIQVHIIMIVLKTNLRSYIALDNKLIFVFLNMLINFLKM
jgi:hypothetical protein